MTWDDAADEQTCEGCRFLTKRYVHHGRAYDCRRYPPVVGTDGYTTFPSAAGRCGEFSAVPTAAEVEQREQMKAAGRRLLAQSLRNLGVEP